MNPPRVNIGLRKPCFLTGIEERQDEVAFAKPATPMHLTLGMCL